VHFNTAVSSHAIFIKKPVLRGHLWDKEKTWPYKSGDFL